jgi:hypothetical protein
MEITPFFMRFLQELSSKSLKVDSAFPQPNRLKAKIKIRFKIND